MQQRDTCGEVLKKGKRIKKIEVRRGDEKLPRVSGRGGGERERKKERERESEWALCDQKACLFSWRLNSSGATLGMSALSSSWAQRLPNIPATGPESRAAGPCQNQNKHLKHGKCHFKLFEKHLFKHPGHLNVVRRRESAVQT